MTHRRYPIYFLPLLALFFTACSLTASGQGCPTIELETPAGMVTPGAPFTVRAVVKSSFSVSNLTFTWTISSGAIEKGQGTDTALVRSMPDDVGRNIDLEVIVSGFSSVCQNKAVGLVTTTQPPACNLPLDEFHAPSANEVKARVDNIFVLLNNNPEHIALFTMEFSESESRKSRLLRITRILDAIKFRKYDPGRIAFLISNESGDSTTVRLFTLSYDTSSWVNQGSLVYGQDMQETLKTLFQDK